MTRLANVSADELRRALDEVDDSTAALRIVVGINYKHGVPQTEMARWYGVSRTTVHNWLERLERLDAESATSVVYDDRRPGRPPKLDRVDRVAFENALESAPSEVGFDCAEWTPALAQAYLEREFDVSYTVRHVRELLAAAGVE